MRTDLLDRCGEASADLCETIRQSACDLHAHVNQTYDGTLPYGFHLNMVADAAVRFGGEILKEERDFIPVFFAAYYHDSIEDARLTYNDVMKTARRFMDEAQALMATEIVYALTNDKGRTRAERAGEKYYEGIRTTPYAPFIKLCDRYANMSYSFRDTNESNHHMREVYSREWPHFHKAITSATDDLRFRLPHLLVEEVEKLIG